MLLKGTIKETATIATDVLESLSLAKPAGLSF